MTTALHIYANLLWRAGSPEARIKKGAALRLLTEPHYRLPLEELAKALASSLENGVSSGLLHPSKLAEILTSEQCFSHSGVTGNVFVDAAALLGAGKACLKELIDITWDLSSPSSWACNQLAWYIVSRQQMDMQAADLFLALADDAEGFIAGAWSSRMVLRDVPYDSPYDTLEELLEGETILELVHKPDGERAVKLAFSALLHMQPHNGSSGNTGNSSSCGGGNNTNSGTSGNPAAGAVQREGAAAAAATSPKATPTAAGSDAEEAAGPDGAGGDVGGRAGRDESVAGLSTSLQQTHLTSAREPQPQSRGSALEGADAPTGFASGGGGGKDSGVRGHGGGGGDVEMVDVDELSYASADDAEDEEEDDGGGGRPGAAPATRSPMCPDAMAATAAMAATGGEGQQRSYLPLRPELLPQYVRGVFAGHGASEQLMAVVAMALVEAGGGGAGGYRGGGAAAAAGGAAAADPFDPYRFSMPLSRLAAVVRERAPYLQPTSGTTERGGGGGVGMLMQRLQERPSRGCFRVLMHVGQGEVEWGADGETGGGGGAKGSDGEGLAVLDLDALQGRVVEAMTAAANALYSGSRPVDQIRRAAATHLATRTRSFARRAHCVRLTTLSTHLAETLPPNVFDPNRLSGLARMVSAETTNNVMHVFRRALPGGYDEPITCVTLNVGKLLSEAGVRRLDAAAAAAAPPAPLQPSAATAAASGKAWVSQRGAGGPDAAAAAAAATAAVAATRAAAAAASAAGPGQHGWSQTTARSNPSDGYGGSQAPTSWPTATSGSHYTAPPAHPAPPGGNAALAPAAAAAAQPPSHHGNGGLPAPPSEATLSEAILALFPPSAPGAGGGDVHPEKEAAIAAKRVAALSLAKALHTQPGGLMPLSSLSDIVQRHAPSATSLEYLLLLEPELFEMQEHWSGGPRGFRLKASAVMARAAQLPPATPAATTTATATIGARIAGVRDSATGLPLRPGVANCPYYMKYGICGYGAACKYNHPPSAAAPSAVANIQRTGTAAFAATAAAAASTYHTQHHQQPPHHQQQPQQQQQPQHHQYQHQQQPQSQYYHHHQQTQPQPQPQAGPAVHHSLAPAAPAAAHGAHAAAATAAAPAAADPTSPAPAVAPATPHAPSPGAVSPGAAVSVSTAGSLAAAGGPGGPAAQSPATLEVKVVTTVCTPGHLDMLQHCFAATQVAIACKTSPQQHHHHPHAAGGGGGAASSGAEASAPCLVQLYAPAVPAAATNAGGGAGGTAGTAAQGSGAAAGGDGGGGGGGASTATAAPPPRWPATVYLVDPVGAGDKGEMLLGSLNALLEDPAVSKVVYWGAEVLPHLVRGCRVERIAPLFDISVLHAMVATATAAASTGAAPRFDPLPPLSTMLQHQGVMTPAGATAMAAAPACSRLWTARPLGPDLKQQAVLEVVHLAALWAGLLGRLAALPQQLSQATADRLVREQVAAHSAAAAAATAAAAAGPPIAVAVVAASPTWSSSGHVPVSSGGPPLPPQPRGLLSVQRRGPGM